MTTPSPLDDELRQNIVFWLKEAIETARLQRHKDARRITVGAAADQITALFNQHTAAREAGAQATGVAWAISAIDDLHIGADDSDTTDRIFKGIKNNLRDLYETEAGIDPAPKYPINVKLQRHRKGGEDAKSKN